MIETKGGDLRSLVDVLTLEYVPRAGETFQVSGKRVGGDDPVFFEVMYVTTDVDLDDETASIPAVVLRPDVSMQDPWIPFCVCSEEQRGLQTAPGEVVDGTCAKCGDRLP